ncbi:conserved protein, unknown function [Plasmodium yoelii]|uniref:THUMP domain-containing protein n=2 Tax=Plasmodium yoelii TaxID=5861 RepID=A0AAE9WVQ4_PLAYO|nr:conserved protein, unknown function [Plasmodium yoelii]WBY61293.1 hypothetical protein Py17XNL_001401468 [Plasmodium yoelii yoelii]CDU20989.1 conserved Plasmodium protein, unknown function [Plasmodium yoelii]VTZ81955.1 conserved protein, unknown function [Plasmodium yoelii]|eukprot:XP_022813064.1 conserved protein, unknown function [Plasmodium yoelii]
MEYKKTKRPNQYVFEGSKHNSKRQKINVNAQCKGILMSALSNRRTNAGIKELLNFINLNFPANNNDVIKKIEATDEVNKKVNGEANNEVNVEVNVEVNGEENGEENKISTIEKELKDEICKANSEHNRFVPLRNIIKNFTFIKFNNDNDLNPSDIINKTFMLATNKKEKYFFRNICKIIPLDTICKPHLSPFIKTLLPLMRKHFTDGKCMEDTFTVNYLLKIMNVPDEKTDEKNDEKNEGKNDEKNGEKSEEKNEGKNDEKNEGKNDEKNEGKNDEKNEGKSGEKSEEKSEEKSGEKNEDSSGNKKSWALIYKCCNTKTLTKRDVLKVLDNCIGNNYSVNLTKPDMAIIVYVTEIMCGISIVKDYASTRKFNIGSFNDDS